MDGGRVTLMAAALAAAGTLRIDAQSVPGESEKGALVICITQWNGGCGTTDDNRTSWDNMVDGWYDDITDDASTPWGHSAKAWWRDGFRQNGTIVDSDFTDASIVSWGDDSDDDNVDEPDACMVALHGGESSDNLRWYGLVRVDESGDGNCYAWQGHMALGDSDLEFLHLSSCNSMNEDVWWGEWQESFDGLHQINGFHGIMWINSTYRGRYEDFSDDAFDISIADSWVDNLYKYRVAGENMCPVSRGVGYSENSLWTRMDHEEYDWVYSDPDGAGWMGVVYIKGCNPKGEPALPN